MYVFRQKYTWELPIVFDKYTICGLAKDNETPNTCWNYLEQQASESDPKDILCGLE